MKRYSFRHHCRYLYIRLLLLCLLAFSSISGAQAGKWKMHSAFDNRPVRIVDTERYTYFQVFQKIRTIWVDTFHDPYTALLMFDKTQPELGIVPMENMLPVKGSGVQFIEYSPEGGFLAILYLDGTLELVKEDGRVVRNETIKNCSDPGWDTIRSMTICGNQVWIAAGDGYVVVDGESGDTKCQARLGIPIDRAAHVAGQTVVIYNNKFYVAPSSSFPKKWTQFSELSLSGPANPKILLPAGENMFIYVANKVSTGTFSLNVATYKEGRWSAKFLYDYWLPSSASANWVSAPFEANFIRNRDGYLMYNSGAVWQIYYDKDPEQPGFIEGHETRKKGDPSQAHASACAGAWTLDSGWSYVDRGTFAPGGLEGSFFLVDEEGAIRPQSPLAAHSTHLVYSPEHGVVGGGYGYNWSFASVGSATNTLLSTYREGKWSIPDPAYIPPRSIEDSPELAALYSNNLGSFPVQGPNGFSIDPANPDYVWVGSTMGGMAAMNLRDPAANPLHFAAASNPLASFPGFKAVFPTQNSWNAYCAVSCPTFDSDGTLWVAYHNLDKHNSTGEGIQLYCWSRKEREQVLSSGDVSLTNGIGVLDMPDVGGHGTFLIQGLHHPSNRNLVMTYVFNAPRLVVRLDHNGTPTDPSDDTWTHISAVEDQNGGKWPIDEVYAIKEDPISGKFWVGNKNSLLGFDPRGEVIDGVIKGEVLDFSEGEFLGNALAHVEVAGIEFDDEGRMWLTSHGAGVWCISADRTRALARYTVENSSLPSDTAYGICFNPESRSLMISTSEGYAELWPDLPGKERSGDVVVNPSEVSPEWSGPVTVRGLVPASKVSVYDRGGNIIRELHADSFGTALWDLTDISGEIVKSGFYRLQGNFGCKEIVKLR